MSKFRNRSIRTLPKHVIKDCKTARGEHSHEHYFGENVDDDSSEYVSTISSSKDNQDFKDLSSSSQMSFNDFYEDRTAKVNEELRRLDRILKGLEPVPSYYSQDEFDQWMTTFPGLCIFDDTEEFNQTAKSKQEDTKKIQSPKSGKKLPICDSTNTSPIKRLGEDAVIKSRNDFRIKD
ncbi:uncharacterized protein LOC109595400 isoform X2 [Aethina tumida]|uniref:uncharacterized protein LOC109595400 isoform X2 n=1 Tax=Aethina tumida TaxID=116153 RepID=UPI002148AC52|nr:uncharacterized protein LOC109595400 isoform X2 [Aethina tumida]